MSLPTVEVEFRGYGGEDDGEIIDAPPDGPPEAYVDFTIGSTEVCGSDSL